MQRAEPDGRIRTLGAFTWPITRDEVSTMFGSGRYWIKSVKPRFRLEWEATLGEPRNARPGDVLSQDISSLKKRTTALTIGLVGLGVATVAGFGLSALGHVDHSRRLDRAELALDTYGKINQISFQCPNCEHKLFSLLDRHCGNCGATINWPNKRQVSETQSQAQCNSCRFPVRPGQLYCTECGSSTTENVLVFRRLS